MSLFSWLFSKEYPGLPGYKTISPSLHYKDPTINNGLEKSSLVVLSRYQEPTQEQVFDNLQQAAIAVVGMKELARHGHQNTDASDLESLMYVYVPEETTQKIAHRDEQTLNLLANYIPDRQEGQEYLLALVGDKPEFVEGSSPAYDNYVHEMNSEWQMDILLQDGNLPPRRDMETLLKYGCVSSLIGINLNPATDRTVMEAFCLLDPLYKYLSSAEKIKSLHNISDKFIDYKAYSTIYNLSEELQPVPVLVVSKEPWFMKNDNDDNPVLN